MLHFTMIYCHVTENLVIPAKVEVLEAKLLASTSGKRTMKPAERGTTVSFLSSSAWVSCLNKQAQHVSVLSFVFFGFVVGFCPGGGSGRRARACPCTADAHIPCRQDSETSGYRTAQILDPETSAGWGWITLLIITDHVSLVADSLCHLAAGS